MKSPIIRIPAFRYGIPGSTLAYSSDLLGVPCQMKFVLPIQQTVELGPVCHSVQLGIVLHGRPT